LRGRGSTAYSDVVTAQSLHGRTGSSRLTGLRSAALGSGSVPEGAMRYVLNRSVPFVVLLMLASPVHAQVSFSFSFGGPPPPPRAYRVPAQPGPAYHWIEGYWYPRNGRWVWHDGYWTRPPFPDSYWVQPYWEGGRYYEGYWYTPRGHYDHDHHWDHDRRRDYDREWREHRDHDDRDHR